MNGYWTALAALLVVLVGGFAYAYVRERSLDARVVSLQSDLASTTAALEAVSVNLSLLRDQASSLSQTLASTKEDFASSINSVQNQVGGVTQTLGSISGQVSTLQKLANTDPELLKKYSKVYFLNENYAPAHLSVVPQQMVYSNTKQEQFLTEALPYLENMIAAAKADGVTIYVASAYRSFGTQAALKSEYTVTYGEGANSFSADQGYSEHQLGTTVDLITPGLNGELTNAFDTTAAYTWLKNNAYKYGFEMSYPKGNSYYVYEPWHWRFVGVQLATYLHNNNLNFYDMDQRDIDTYLANLFG
jgi:D-alanyl-D-alanine carboxypeptidase